HTLQAGGELFHPAADPALDGSLRSTEALGHLDVAETAVVGQRDRLTLPFGKFFEGGTDMLGKAATPYLVLEVEVLGIGRSGLPARPRLLGADHVDGAAMGDRQQEGAKSAPGGVVSIGTLPEGDEGVLDHVFGQRLIPQDP